MTIIKKFAFSLLLAFSIGNSYANSTAIKKADTLIVKIGYDSSFVDCEYVFDFKDSSILISSTDSIVFWEWDFGDGSKVSRIPYPTHKYSTYDSFTIKLVVMLSNGLKDSTTKDIYLPGPFADFTFAEPYQDLDTITICQGQDLFIVNTSTGDLIDQDFDDVWWGDGEVTSPGKSWDVAKHTYHYAGNFMLTLRVYAQMHGLNMNCTSSYPHYDENKRTRIQKVVVVREAPPVGLEIGTSPTYRYHPTGFNPIFDSLLNASRVLYYGDGDSSVVMNDDTLLVHQYQSTNSYEVKFIATYETKDQQQRNCADTFAQQIMVMHDSLNSVTSVDLECEVYPIPTTGLLNIQLSKGIETVEILNAMGSVIRRQILPTGAERTQLDLQTLPKGVYLLKIKTKGGELANKRVILN